MNSSKISLLVLALGFAASCTPKPNVTQANTISAENLQQGKTIFENSCARCHDLPNPTAYTSVEWVGIMNSMAPKAKLTDEQHELTYNYVSSLRKAYEAQTQQ